MAQGSILDFNAAEHRRSPHEQGLGRFRGVGLKMSCLILIRAKNPDALHDDQPVFRNNNLTSAEKRIGLDHGFAALDIRMPEIDLVASENRNHARALKVFGIDMPFPASKNVEAVQPGMARHSRPFLSHCLPQHRDPGDDDEYRPEFPEIQANETHLMQLEESSDRNEGCADWPSAGEDDLDEADQNEDRRPEMKDQTGGEVAQSLEQEKRADNYADQTPDQRPAIDLNFGVWIHEPLPNQPPTMKLCATSGWQPAPARKRCRQRSTAAATTGASATPAICVSRAD